MMLDFVSVSDVAKSLGVSVRRVRYLLEQGRLRGFKRGRRWEVFWPLFIIPGRRGPDLKHFPVRHVLRAVKPLKVVK